MFYIDSLNKIYLTRGDDAEIIVKLYDDKGIERQIFDDDEIIITVRKTISSPIGFTKTAEKGGIINIAPTDTEGLEFGDYIYDIQLTTFGGKTYAVIPPSTFEIGPEVSV